MRLILFLALLSVSQMLHAAQCSAVFPSALQGHSDSGRLTIISGAKVLNSPTTVLPFVSGSISTANGDSCGTADCSVTGFASDPISLPTFPTFSGNSYNSYGGTLGEGNAYSRTFNNINAFSGTTRFSNNYNQYFLQSLNISDNARVALKPGTYWIRTININYSSGADDVGITVEGTGTVYLYVENLNINGNRVINGITANAALNINAYNNVILTSPTKVSALLYANGTVEINDGSVFTGIISAANVTLNSNSTMVYVDDLLTDFDFSSICDVDNNQDLRLQYEFDQLSWETAGDVLDSSGNGQNGTALGNVKPASYNGGTCKILDVPANTSSAQTDAVDTLLDMNDVGDTGSIAFWYRSDLSWSDSTRRQLFDASNDITSPNKHFYLTLGGGVLQFSVEDENDRGAFATISNLSVNANTWVHITVTWDLPNKFLRVHLNTSNQAQVWQLTDTGLANRMGDLSTLYIGDSRGSYFLNRSTGNSAHGQFESFHVFDYVLTNNEARTVAEATPNCTTQDANLVAHWPINVCALDGTGGEVIDIVGSLDGQAVSGAGVSLQGKLCQAGDFYGEGEHLNLPHGNGLAVSDGSVSMWFNTSDLSHNVDSTRDGMAIWSKDSNGRDNGGDHLTLYVKSDGSVNARHQSTSSDYFTNSAANLVQENTWHHLVYTFGNDGIKLYLDNTLVGSNAYTGGLAGNPEPIIIGSGAWQTGDNVSEPSNLKDHFIGQIDDVRFYEGQLNATQIDELYQEVDSNCLDCNVALNVALYSFEQDQWDGPNQVLDTSGNDNHGTALGLAAPVFPSEQVACKAMDVPDDDSITGTFNGFDTQVDINTLGQQGTISFWYRSNEDWNSGNPRQLLDASTNLGNNNNSKYFYLTLNSSGRLDFNMEDSGDRNFGASTANALSFAAQEWVHVAVSWDIVNQSIQIFIDGVAQSLTSNSESGLSGSLGQLDTLYVGDNRSSYLVVSGTRFSANGQFDDVRIHDNVQTSAQVNEDKDNLSTCAYVYKYQISHDGNGLTCEPETITIRACKDDSCAADQLFESAHSITLEPIDGWVGGNTLTVPSTGILQAQLGQTTAGNYTLNVLGENSDCVGTATNTCDIVFADAGFQFVGATTTDPFPHQLAEQGFVSGQIRAVKTDSNTSQCVAALAGEQNVEFSMSCDDPGSCNVGIETAGNTITDAGFTPVTLTFDDQGVADFSSFSYADAGLISLNAQAQIDGVDVAQGSTQFAVYPDALTISSSATQSLAAGEDFTITLTALGAQQGTLPNYRPGNLQLQLLRLTPTQVGSVNGVFNYAQSLTRSVPVSGNFSDSDLSATTTGITFGAGVMTIPAFYSETGSFSMDVRDSNFHGNSISSASGNGTLPITLGTFIPAYYDVTANAPSLSSYCSVSTDFSYLGKDLSFGVEPEFVVTAKNALGDTTENHFLSADWSWLSSRNLQDVEFDDPSHGEMVSYVGTPTLSVSDNGIQGSKTLTFSNSRLVYGKSDDPSAPFAANLNMNLLPRFFTDDLGVCYQQSYSKGAADDCDTALSVSALDDTNNLITMPVSSSTQMRWGRLRIDNGFGPENQVLKLQVNAEYYNGSRFVANVDDSCTSLSLTSSDFSLTLPDGTSTTAISVLPSSMVLSGGRSLPFEGIQVENQDTTVSGEYRIELLPKNDSTITWDDYLQFDWNGTDSGFENPAAMISFGQFRGNDRIIHWREVNR